MPYFPHGMLVLVCNFSNNACAIATLLLSADGFSITYRIHNTFLLNFICTFVSLLF